MKKSYFVFVLTLIWLLTAYWLHKKYLPFDVKNTDVGTYLFQAQTFAHGEIYRQTPEPREFFQQWQAIVRDKSYSYYGPVHGLFLAVPLVLNLNPWLMPWILSGACIFFVFVWVRKLVDENTAIVATLLLALSPFFAANIPSLLSHSTTLFLTILFLLAVHSWQQTGGLRSALLTGICLGLVFATRSANAAALGIVWIPYVVYVRREKIKTEFKSWISFGVGAALITLPLLIFYKALAGYWTLDLFKDYWPRNKYGFGQNLGRGEPGHFFQTSTNHDWNGFLENLKYSFTGLGEWWTGNLWVGVIFLILLLIVMGMKRSQKNLIPIIIWTLVHIGVYAFYFTQSTPPTGPRYLAEIIPALALLGSWTITSLWSDPKIRWIAPLVLIAFAVAGIYQKKTFYTSHAKVIPLQKKLQDTVLKNAETPALVLIRSFWIGHPFPIFLNHPDLKDPVLYACDRGEEDKKLISKYPERNAYVLSVDPKGSTELIPIYRAKDQASLKNAEDIEAPFWIGSGFTKPLKLQGEEFRRLFHPKPEEIVPQ